jgi:hypothetical protein
MERRLPAVAAVALLAVTLTALALSAAVAAPAGAQTATPADPPTNGSEADDAVGTAIEVSFDGSLTEAERERAAGVVEARLAGSPGYNGTVRTTEEGLVVQVRPTAPPAVVDLLLQQGNVTVTAHTPEGSDATLFTNADVRGTGGLRQGSGAVVLPVYLTPGGAQNMSATLVRLNHTSNPGSCDQANRTGYCLLVGLDGSVVNTAGITPRFADVVEAGNFTGERGFAVATETVDPAVRLQVALAAVPLPANATATGVENVTAFEGGTETPTDGPSTAAPGEDSPTATPAGGPSNGTLRGGTETPVTAGDGSPGFTPAALLVALLALAALAAQTLRS